MFWMSIDLDELSKLDRKLRYFGHNRKTLISILDRDYGGPGEGDIQHRIRKHLERAGIDEIIDQIELMTIPRIVGYVFNPVSFYLCSTADGTIRTLVAEVRNTFGEMHHYVASLEPDDQENPTALECRISKQFYVSPFLRNEGEYHIHMKKTGEEFSINISLHEHTGLVFSASMHGTGQELNSSNLRRALLRLPFFAMSIMTRIHLQALRLYFRRRLTMFEKPPLSHPSSVPASHFPWWLRLRTAVVRLGASRRPLSCQRSDIGVPPKDSQ